MSAVTEAVAGLKVLAFCDYYGRSTRGGTDRAAAEIYRRLAAWGAEVTVVSASFGRPADVDCHGVRVLEHPAHDLSRMVGAQVSLAPGLTARALEAARTLRPDVLHANNLFFQTSLAAARVQHRVGVPLVTTAHIAGTSDLSPLVGATTRLYERTFGRAVLRRSTRAIAVSQAVADNLRKTGASLPITVIPNGVDHERFFPDSTATGTPGPSPGSPLVVTFVGRLIANKGPAAAIEAIRRVHCSGLPVRAYVVGDGPLRARLEAGVAASGLRSVIQFTGHIPDVETRLRESHVLLRPSSTEGLPLAVLEAMAAGACVIASDIPGNAELVKDGVNGCLFPLGNIDALVAKLRRVLEDPTLRARLTGAARTTALAHSWDRCAADNASVLLQAARPAGAGIGRP